jgi:hypothetical protein
MKKIALFFVVLLSISCNNEARQKQAPVIEKDSINQVQYSVVVIDNSGLKNIQKQNIYTIPQDSLKYGYIDGIPIFIFGVHTVYVLTDDILTYYLLGSFVSWNHFKNTHYYFEDNKQFVEDKEAGIQDTIHEFTYKESFVKAFWHNNDNTLNIVSGQIINGEIKLVENIHVGMSKNNLLQKIFSPDTMLKFDFERVDTLINSATTSDIKQNYIFDNDTLKKIIIESDYDWIPFDL